MRTVKAISPSSLHTFETDRELFYSRYLSEAPRVWQSQSAPAIVGSSFDAMVKCKLYRDLFGNTGGGEYRTEAMFDRQCENVELRQWAWYAGQWVFECYKDYGLYHELLMELSKSDVDPKFEFSATGEIEGVPIKGKPDLWYKRDVGVTYDWKVNGYCTKSAISPKKLYRRCRDCWPKGIAKPTRGGGQPRAHPKYVETEYKGHLIGEHCMSHSDKRWADQLCIYELMQGEPGVVGIDQIACKPGDDKPLIRVAQHRCRISDEYRESVITRLKSCWEIIQSGHIFDDMTREKSDSCCEVLDMPQPEDDEDGFWAACTERQYRG